MRPRACADSCLGGKAAAADPLVLLSGMFVLVSAVGCVTSLLSVAKVVVKVADVRAVVYCVTFHLTATALLRQSWPFPKNSISISLPLTLLLLRVLLLLLLLPDHSLICSLSPPFATRALYHRAHLRFYRRPLVGSIQPQGVTAFLFSRALLLHHH